MLKGLAHPLNVAKMRPRVWVLTTMATVALAVVTIAGLPGAGKALTGTSVHQVSGSGTVDWPGGRVTYAFKAQSDSGGVARGQAQFNFRGVPGKLHVIIDCLRVDGNNAWLSGEITKSDISFANVGDETFWQVEDNGGGAAAEPDMISTVFVVLSENECASERDVSRHFMPWTNGGVRVK